MQEIIDLIYALRYIVMEPTLATASALMIFSALNEVILPLPFSIVIASQLTLFDSALTMSFIAKLFFLVALPVGIGSTLGTLPLYALAYFGGRRAINKYEKYLHFSWSDVEKFSNHLQDEWYDEALFLGIRSLPILPSPPLTIAAGIIRFRFIPYLIFTTIGFTIRMVLTLIFVGFGIEGLYKLLSLIYNI